MRRLRTYYRMGVVLMAGVALTAGCASQGLTRISTRPTTPLRSYRTLAVEVSSTVDAAGDMVGQLEKAIINTLRERQLFERVYATMAAADQAFDLKLAVLVTDLRRVDAGDRLQSGPLAGRGTLNTDMALIEGKSQKTLAKAKMVGKTSVDLLLSGTTAQAVRRVAEQVVTFVAQYY